MKSVGYVRVSTDEQAKEGVSLAAQEAKIRAYSSLNGLDLVEVIQDAARSGKTLQRAGLQRLIGLCLEKAISHVVTYKLDRLTRKTKDLLYLMEDVFLKNEVEFHSISEKIDTATAQGKFFLTLMGAMAQMERDLISERTKDALAFMKANGQRLGHPSFGLHVVDGQLVQDEQEVAMAACAGNLRSQGLTLKQIAQKMIEHGYKPKRAGNWSLSSLHDLLGRSLKSDTLPSIMLTEPRILKTSFTD